MDAIHALRKDTVVLSSRKPNKKSKGQVSFLPDFDYIEVNGLRFTDPYQIYPEICRGIFKDKKHMSIKTSTDALEDYFSRRKDTYDEDDKFVVLLVDELDLLCTKKQTIVYHLFDWPNKPFSNLVVVAIANAMDLPERVLETRVASRLGLTRLTFQPYTHQELQEILLSRLEGTTAFDSDAVQLVARKVAAVSGDARRALDICRRATLISETKFKQSQEKRSVVKVEDVHDALKEIFSSTKFVAVRALPLQQRVFLQAIAHEFKVSGLSEAVFSNVIRHHEDICKVERFPVPSTSQLMEVALSLYERRLILLQTNAVFLKTKILLNVSMDDIDFALKSCD